MPARHRDTFKAAGSACLAITKHPDGCLMVFPEANWIPFRDRVSALPMEALAWKRVFLGFVSEVEIDGSSRVLIDPVLREYAGFDAGSKVLLLGLGPHFELWENGRYQAREAVAVTQPMPDAIKAFTY